MKIKARGFTLVEIAIVLVVIGLLAGGILKGQQMIENAKYKAWVKEVDTYRAAFAEFQLRYKYMPGDYPFPSRLNPPANFTPIAGGGDGLISSAGGGASLGFQSVGGESARVASQLIMAGFLTGDAAAEDQRRVTPVGGALIFMGTSSAAGVLKQKMYFRFVPVKYAG